MRACVASLLDLPALEVPHFFDYAGDDGEPGIVAMRDWLNPRGYEYLELEFKWNDIGPQLFCWHVLIGDTPSKLGRHACVAWNLEVKHDPHPARRGLVPMYNSEGQPVYHAGFLIATCQGQGFASNKT